MIRMSWSSTKVTRCLIRTCWCILMTKWIWLMRFWCHMRRWIRCICMREYFLHIRWREIKVMGKKRVSMQLWWWMVGLRKREDLSKKKRIYLDWWIIWGFSCRLCKLWWITIDFTKSNILLSIIAPFIAWFIKNLEDSSKCWKKNWKK